jgi:thiol:disulfide interchange protein DsbA
MDRLRRKLIVAAALTPIALPLRAQNAAAASYTTLRGALPIENPGKIEIAEFFWYGCIHCYNLEAVLETWLKKQPRDVEFRRIPAVFNRQMELDALIFYSFEALGVLAKVHRPFFDAIHRDHLRTSDRQALNEFLQKNGIDGKKFDDALKSFGVQSKTRRAKQLTVDYKIDGTPAMGVNGRYTISAGDGLLPTVDALVERERKKK